MKIITIVTPLGIGIASNIISKYGFEPNQPGNPLLHSPFIL